MLVTRPEWAQAKAVKFLRHEGYLYLSTMLDADEKSARDVMAELDAYVRTVPVDAYGQVRPALRVAFFHLLRGDVEGVRRAMRFEKWGAVVDSRLVSDGDRVLFERDPHIEVLDRPSRDWLDVTSLRLVDLPFEMRRYLHTVEVYERDGDDVTVYVRTVDHLGDLEASGRDGDALLWRGVGPLSLAPHRLVSVSDRGTIRVILSMDGRINSTPVRTRCTPTSFDLRSLARARGAAGVREEPRERAELAWRATGESRGVLPLMRRLLMRSRTPAEPGLPTVVDRVFVAYLPMSDLPEPWRRVPFDLDTWNERFGSRAVLLVGGEHMPPVPFRMRGWVWDVRRMRVDHVIAVSAVVITDDPLLLAAHPDAIAYRPDRGAVRYLLPPLTSAVSEQDALFDAVDERLGGR
jgi:hypothetical protein